MATELTVKENEQLETAVELMSSVGPLVRQAKQLVEAWIDANDERHHPGKSVVQEHFRRLEIGASAVADRIGQLGSLLSHPALASAYESDFPNTHPMVESEMAYTQEQLDRLSNRDLRDAVDFSTEMKDTFGFITIDEELETPLAAALKQYLIEVEDGTATMAGAVAKMLKVLFKGNARCFGRYYSGKDVWPRPSAVVQVEIDERMPAALDWLQHELKEALEEEAASPPEPNNGDDKGQ